MLFIASFFLMVKLPNIAALVYFPTLFLSVGIMMLSCKKNTKENPPEFFQLVSVAVSGISGGPEFKNVPLSPDITLEFSEPVNPQHALENITLRKNGNIKINLSASRSGNKIVFTPQNALEEFSEYLLTITPALQSEKGAFIRQAEVFTIKTSFDTADKFPRIPEEDLLTLVQQQTFKYFWDFAHPVSGMARERNTSGEIVTTGGTGFGIMAILVGIHRNFITREEGLDRILTITNFLSAKVEKIHGAFPHWVNGSTGATVPFSEKDNGADLVETSLLMQGLITAREYFNSPDPKETELRNKINALWENVEWDFFRKDGENVLYWHYSNEYLWDINLKIQGWNECLITYVLAASSPTYSIPKEVYDEGWARAGAMKNGNSYYNIPLPLGPNYGGPMFFAHYSFLGLDPFKLQDDYASYGDQNQAHARIQWEYAKDDPKHFGYSEYIWGLTASDHPEGYAAHSPANDLGIVAPTAALSSFPYTPEASMKALETYYYKLGNRLWKEYGFVDAFSPSTGWVANSFLAIDQGPIIIMIENYRTGFLWNLFMNAPEIKQGLSKLGFRPY